MVYGDGTQLIGYSAVGVGHTVPVHETIDLAWFCISGACTSTGTMTTSTTSTPTSTSSTGGGTIAEYGQW
jgi:acetylxylan esterase